MIKMTLILFFGLFLSSLGWGKSVDKTCDLLAEAFKKEFVAPFRQFQNEKIKSCVFKNKVTDQTLSLYLASAFYYQQPEVRKKALQRLDNYTCGEWMACREMYKQLDAHIKTSALSNSSLVTISKADQLRMRSLSRVNEMKNSITIIE